MKKRMAKDPLEWIHQSDDSVKETNLSNQEYKASGDTSFSEKSTDKPKKRKTKTTKSAIHPNNISPTTIQPSSRMSALSGLTVNEDIAPSRGNDLVDREPPALSSKDETTIQCDDQWVTFRINKEFYAFHIRYVREIVTGVKLTQMPDAVDYLAGLTQIRDMTIPVIHLKKYFHMSDQSIPEQVTVIVVSDDNTVDGFLVDEMLDVLPASETQWTAVPETLNRQREKAIEGILRCSYGLVGVLNPQLIIYDTNHIQREQSRMETNKIHEKDSLAERTAGIAGETLQFVSFFIEKDEFAINIKDVQEINKMSTIAHVPKAPKFVEGVINLRGNIVPVINLRERFGIEKKPYDRNTRIIVIHIADKQIGLIVDSVSEVIRISVTAIKEPPTEAIYHDTGLVEGMAEIGGRIVIIINLQGILTHQEKEHLKSFQHEE